MSVDAYVVTGAGRGIGRAIAERLSQDCLVIALDADGDALTWTRTSLSKANLAPIVGDASKDETLEHLVNKEHDGHVLRGRVNNTAVFHDTDLHSSSSADISTLIQANLAPVIAGCRSAVREFLHAGVQGAIVNISSHQTQRPVSRAMAYATAKAAIEA